MLRSKSTLWHVPRGGGALIPRQPIYYAINNILAARAEIAFDRIGDDVLQGLGKANYAR